MDHTCDRTKQQTIRKSQENIFPGSGGSEGLVNLDTSTGRGAVQGAAGVPGCGAVPGTATVSLSRDGAVRRTTQTVQQSEMLGSQDPQQGDMLHDTWDGCPWPSV